MSGSLTLAGGRTSVADNPYLRVATITVSGALVTCLAAVAASFAGFSEQVALPDWWGPWPTGPDASPLWQAVELAAVGVLGIVWLGLALRWLSPDGTPGPSLPPVGALVGIVAGWAAPLIVSGPMASLDVESYAAVGRLATLGINPYQVGPGALGDAYSAAVSPLWMWTPTPYGPVQVALLKLAATIGGDHVGATVMLIRLLAILGFVAAVALALRAAAPAEQSQVMLLVALNPVVLVTVVSGAHLDVLVGALAVLVVLLVRSDRRALAMVAAVIALLIKLPGAALVGYVLLDTLRRTPAGRRTSTWLWVVGGGLATTGAVALLVPDPFGWVSALGVPGTTHDGMAPSTWVSSLIALVSGQTAGAGLDHSFVIGRVVTAAAGAATAGLLLWRATGTGPSRLAYQGVGWGLIAVALCGPSTYPWYLTWGLFAAAVAGTYRQRLWLTGLCAVACVVGCFSGGALSVVVVAALVAAVAVVVNRQRRPELVPAR